MSGIASRHARAFAGALLGVGLLLAFAIAGQELAKGADRSGSYWNYFGYPLLAATVLLLILLSRIGRRTAFAPLAAASIGGYFLPLAPIVWLGHDPYGLVLIGAGSLAAIVSLSIRRQGRSKVALWELLMSLFWGATGYLLAALVWLAFFYDWP